MAKITFEFNLESETPEVKDFLEGVNFKLAMWDLDQELRKTTKYQESVLNHDYLFHLESDLVPPPDVIERLIIIK
jgi:hypothetical protein